MKVLGQTLRLNYLENTLFPKYHNLSPWVRDGLYLMEHCCSERTMNGGCGLNMMLSLPGF